MKEIRCLTKACLVGLIIFLALLTTAPSARADEDYGSLVDGAERSIQSGKYAEVITSCDKAIAMSSDLPKPYSMKAYALRALKRNDEAQATYDAALATGSMDPALVHGLKGDTYYESGDNPNAVDEYDQAANSAEGTKDMYLAFKAQTMSRMGFLDVTIGMLERIVKDNPKLRVCKLLLSDALNRRGGELDTARVKELLEGLLKENAADVYAAYAYAMLGRKPEMLALVKKLVKDNALLRVELARSEEFEPFWDDPEFKAALAP